MYEESIKKGISDKVKDNIIARKIFLSYPTKVFIDNAELEFEIRNSIAEYFNIPITSVQVCGSSKIGYSYFKNTEFNSEVSDLDISIISQSLFLEYMNEAYYVTKGYTDNTAFSDLAKISAINRLNSFRNTLAKGIIRPDLFPNCNKRTEWFQFFNRLSKIHKSHFKSINAGVYCNESFFEYKQSDIIQKVKERIK